MAKPKLSPITITASQNIPLNQLKLSDDNVRKIYSKEAVTDLAADIHINGLIQSLSVRPLPEPDGDITHEVIGGGRRFRALHQLVKQKALAANALIPCVPNDNAIAAQISLAENISREALHPLDEYRAFAEMLAKGKSEDDIAEAFRTTVHTVRQRLRLGTASPILHKAFQDEKITLQTLMAFCVTENHERQERVWKQLQDTSYFNTHSIRQMLMEEAVPFNDKRVVFLGLDTYQKAGGAIEKDLFTLEHEGYLTDADLLNQLVQAKLDREADKLKAKGWNWAKAAVTIPYSETYNYDQLTPENEDLTEEQEQQLQTLETEREALQDIDEDKLSKKQAKRLETVEAEIDAIENRAPQFTADDMARSGVTLEIGHDGRLNVEYGYVKPVASQQEDTHAAEDAVSDNINAPNPSPEPEDDGDPKIPDSLVAELTIQRTACLQSALAANPDVAFLATLHALTLSAFYHYGSQSCLQLTASTNAPSNVDGLKGFAPTKLMMEQRKAWKARLPQDSHGLWDALKSMDRAEHMQLLAYVSATTLNAVVQKHDKRTQQVQHSHVLAEALNYEIRKDWTATADNFFARVTKATILASVAEARDEHTANLISHMKKIPMAGEAQRLIDGTGWIPAPMRCDASVVVENDDGDREEETGLPDFLQADGEPETTPATA